VKRFWDKAAIAEAEGGRFAISLDGRPVRLPGGAPLGLGARPLAEAVAEEWNLAGGARGGDFTHEDLPLTRLIGTAEERIAPDPAPTVAALARYAETDLLCYRAEDQRLAARQAAGWDPLLAWAAQALDAPLAVTAGIMPLAQSAGSLAALHRAIAAHPPIGIAALGVAVPALGSLVLGLALLAGRLEAAEASALATLDERFQEEFWGTDPEREARRAAQAAEVALAARLVALARG
jgi:chaperone required for assembly of F1-ATPase